MDLTATNSKDKPREDYRNMLQEYAKESQNSFDKTVLTLSGGALGLSLAFIDQIIGDNPIANIYWLSTAWSSWVVSLTSILFSFYMSHWAHRNAIVLLDKGENLPKTPGGIPDKITLVLNALSGIAFLVGAGAMIAFVLQNLR